MQDHRFDFVVDGTPEEVWDVYWKGMRAGITTDTVTITILHQGDEAGNGLVRHCRFPVPKYLLSRGRAQSWEWITESERPVSWRYDAIGKPLWSTGIGVDPARGPRGREDQGALPGDLHGVQPGDAGAPRAAGATTSSPRTTTRSSRRRSTGHSSGHDSGRTAPARDDRPPASGSATRGARAARAVR